MKFIKEIEKRIEEKLLKDIHQKLFQDNCDRKLITLGICDNCQQEECIKNKHCCKSKQCFGIALKRSKIVFAKQLVEDLHNKLNK